jgi:hypothetical protein
MCEATTREELTKRITDLEDHTYTMDKEFEGVIDETYEPYVIAGMTYMPSTILRRCDDVAWREFYNDWADAEMREAQERLDWLGEDSDDDEEESGDVEGEGDTDGG